MFKKIDLRVDIAMNLIHEDPIFPHTITSLAASVYVSPSHFSQLFKMHAGMPVASFIRRHRLARSLYLLQHTSLTMKEIASTCGFSSRTQFHHAFRRTYQFAPAYADSCNPSICDTGCSTICGEDGHSAVSAACCPDGICYCYCANEAPPVGGCP